MEFLDRISHGVIIAIANLAHLIFSGVEAVEDALRQIMSDVGLNMDAQTLMLLFLLVIALFGVSRLMRGALRLWLALIIILVLSHTLEHLVAATVVY